MSAIDDALIDAAVDGDRAAVAELLQVTTRVAVRYLRARMPRTVDHAVDVDDLAQEVVVALLRKLPEYRHKKEYFLPLVYSIASNKVADVYRRPGTARSVSVADVPEPGIGAAAAPGADQLQERAEVQQCLQHLLTTVLSPQQREILRLRVIMGHSAEDTAASLGVTSAGAVRVAQHRALEKLRAALRDGHGTGPFDATIFST